MYHNWGCISINCHCPIPLDPWYYPHLQINMVGYSAQALV